MLRRTKRQALRIENLERREVMSGPSPEAQYLLEQVNAVRTNPGAEIQKLTANLDSQTVQTLKYYGVNLNQAVSAISSAAPRQPLAWSDSIAQAAQYQSNDQAQSGVQSHTSSNGWTLNSRFANFGVNDATNGGEVDFAYATSLDNAMDAFLLDWGNPDLGHRTTLQQPGVSDSASFGSIGIGITATNSKGLGPNIVTMDLARESNAKAEVLGVAYNDPNKTGAYTLGSGAGGVTITAINTVTGASTSVQTWDAGGYQIPLDPGTYAIQASVGNQIVNTQTVTVGTQNVEVDFVMTNPWSGQTVTPPTANPPVAIAPAPTPAPVVAPPTPVVTPPTPVVATPTTTPAVAIVPQAETTKPTASTPSTPSPASSVPSGTVVFDPNVLDAITDWSTNWTV